jgi:hypothetical protein
VNTDRIIDLLSANLEPVGRVHFARTLLVAMLAGAAAAFALMLATVGHHPLAFGTWRSKTFHKRTYAILNPEPRERL